MANWKTQIVVGEDGVTPLTWKGKVIKRKPESDEDVKTLTTLALIFDGEVIEVAEWMERGKPKSDGEGK